MPVGEHAFVASACHRATKSMRSAPLRSRRAAPRPMTPDYGFMYSRSFFDLDGHGWQVMGMDPAAAGERVEKR